MIGEHLGHYHITASLGTGGMGEVFRATDTRLDREVAIKVLPRGVAADPDRLARFEREAKVVAALNHPNIVTLFSIEEAQGARFLTMELVDGETLDRVISPGGLPVARVLDLSIPLTDALAAAHARGIVHRDLKPSNVMLSRDGRVKVLDFGLAKLADAEPPAGPPAMTVNVPVSTAGQLLGTVPYMAPEQVRGETADARTDLFALGAVIYEMITGRRPFEGASSAEVASAILRDTPAPVVSFREDVPPDLVRTIARCLEKNAEHRIQTAKDLRDELELVRRGAAAGSSLFRAPLPPSSREAPSIAVLPFVNRSRDEKDEYFSDGLADELLSVLSKIRGLRVAARTSSATFKGKQVTVGEVGRALNVATVLEGSVRKSGNRVRIAVHLVKVADGYHLWSETYDRTLDDIFAVQDDIAQSVVKELRTTLMGTDANSRASGEARAAVAAAAKGRAGNVEAHRLYLQGKYFVDRLTQQDTARGIEHLKRALEIDPGNASAWTCLGRAYSRQISWAWAPVFEGHQRARDAVERALSLAPDLAEAHVLLCHLQTMIEWDWKGAEASSRRALELAPGSAEVLREASVLATLHGRLEEAADLMRRSIAQDPLSSTGYSQLGYIYRSLGRPADALREYRKALELAPQRAAAHHMIAIILAEQGRLDEALAEAEAEPEEWTRLTALAIIHHLAGRQAESDEALRLLEVRCSGDSAFQIGAVHASRGEADAAFAWLDRAFAQRDTGLTQLQCEPALRPIQADPRWRALLEKLGFEI